MLPTGRGDWLMVEFVNELLTPLTYAFIQRGLLAALMVGVLCSVIGCYIVLRSMAFLGDAMAHAVLPGVAVAYLLGRNLTLGALAAALVVALGVGLFSRRGAIKEDTAIGVLFAAALSLGVVLISSIRTYAVDLSHILFGNVLGVTSLDLWLTAGLGAVILISILVFYQPFLIVSFDPVLAATLRMRVGFYNNLLLVLLALTIVISMQTVGVGLVAAMLVTPAATAFLLVRRLPTMMVLSGLIGGFSSLTGLFASYHLNVASGAAIVLTTTIIFLLAFLFAPQRGLIWDLSRRRTA
jgi:ABC-type Mn2+/Zn2+ transport system permease subunit